jgi:L-amino acid N-acyltransferase YncA
MNIRQVKIEDAGEIIKIYNWYVLNTAITFETDVVTLEEMSNRINDKLKMHDWLIGEMDNKIIGYAYYCSFRPRAAYRHTVESTIYLSQHAIGKGYGKLLYTQLLESAKERGFREVIGVIALPNPESVKLHEKLEFSKVGVLRNVGCKFENYINVEIWQKST